MDKVYVLTHTEAQDFYGEELEVQTVCNVFADKNQAIDFMKELYEITLKNSLSCGIKIPEKWNNDLNWTILYEGESPTNKLYKAYENSRIFNNQVDHYVIIFAVEEKEIL